MKLYDGMGPNPHAVRMFIAEKGNEGIETITIDLMAAENRSPEHLARNPTGQIPTLETDDGSFISEVTAICEYLEEIHPEPALIGNTAEQRAETRMWVRKLDLALCEPMGNGFRFGDGLQIFENRIPCYPEAADSLKAMARNGLELLEKQLAGKTWICGERFTLADILVFCLVNFFNGMGQPVDEALTAVHGWMARCSERPSASA